VKNVPPPSDHDRKKGSAVDKRKRSEREDMSSSSGKRAKAEPNLEDGKSTSVRHGLAGGDKGKAGREGSLGGAQGGQTQVRIEAKRAELKKLKEAADSLKSKAEKLRKDEKSTTEESDGKAFKAAATTASASSSSSASTTTGFDLMVFQLYFSSCVTYLQYSDGLEQFETQEKQMRSSGGAPLQSMRHNSVEMYMRTCNFFSLPLTYANQHKQRLLAALCHKCQAFSYMRVFHCRRQRLERIRGDLMTYFKGPATTSIPLPSSSSSSSHPIPPFHSIPSLSMSSPASSSAPHEQQQPPPPQTSTTLAVPSLSPNVPLALPSPLKTERDPFDPSHSSPRMSIQTPPAPVMAIGKEFCEGTDYLFRAIDSWNRAEQCLFGITAGEDFRRLLANYATVGPAEAIQEMKNALDKIG